MNAETYLSRILMKKAGLDSKQSSGIANAIVHKQKTRSICEGKKESTPLGVETAGR